MAKILKILAYIIGSVVEWLLIFVISFAFLIRTSQVQSYVARKATSFLSKELKTTVKVQNVEFLFLHKLSLKDVVILDLNKDSLLCSKEITLEIKRLNLRKNKFEFSKAALLNGTINVSRSRDNGDYNYQFLADYFSSDSKSKGKPATLVFNEIQLENFNLKYDDNRKSHLKFGLDYDHLNIRKLALNINAFKIENEDINFKLNYLKLDESCGLKLSNLSGDVLISPKKIQLTKTHIKTPNTKLNLAKFMLKYKNWESFDNFDDEVIFDARILPSVVDMRDVSLFAPDIEGMQSKVLLKANVSDKLKSLKISGLDMRFGKKSIVQGDFILPDFRKDEQALLNETIAYAYVDFKDLEEFSLPKGTSKISFSSPISNLQFAEIKNLKTRGKIADFNLIFKSINTNTGTIALNNYFRIQNKNEGLYFAPIQQVKDSIPIVLSDFNLANFIENSTLGMVKGVVGLSGFVSNDGDVSLENINANLNQFDLSGYSYSGITIKNGSLKNDEILADLQLNDPNINLIYTGKTSIGRNQKYDFDVTIQNANLYELGFTSEDSISFSTHLRCDLQGASLDKIKGNITSDFITYQEGDKNLEIPLLNVGLERTENSDNFNIVSSLLNASLSGKINYETVIEDFLSELAVIFPSLIAKDPKHKKGKSDFSFEITTGELNDLLAIFVPDLVIEKGTKLSGNYNSINSSLNAHLNSNFIQYQEFAFKTISFNQAISKIGIIGGYQVESFTYDDSLKFENVQFSSNGMGGVLNSKLTWDPNTKDFSSIEWQTIVLDNDLLNFQVHPSFFSLNGLQWEIKNESEINLSSEDINISNLRFARKNQELSINGCLSKNNSDKLKLDIQKLDLDELTQILGLPSDLSGTFSGWGEISNPYTNFNYMGDARIENFKLDNQEVGNIQLMSDWNEKRESVILSGDLEYKNQRTFDFSGMYDIASDKLDMNLNFENTDIAFTNAFMDPSVVKDIQGKLNGKIRVKGSPNEPKLDGNLKLSNGAALVELLGVKYNIDGNIIVENDAFLINPTPVKDEEGNTASLVGTINHNNFEKWNFDLQFNFEDDLFKRPLANGRAVPLERFMVLKTKYKDGDIYYGTAYARGYANIEGTESNLSITVEAETKENTQIYFPMYGFSEIDESEDFVTIIDKSVQNKLKDKKIDLTGIDLDMKFKVNQNAKMNLIFNEITNDEIKATGKGEINLKLDQLNNVFLEGTYTIMEGSKYNFTMVGIQQPFEIEKGSTIKWSGSPYDADININTYVNLKKVSILELSPDLMDNSLLNQEINCYLKLNETLMKPQISFDIQAPRAPETGKALIRRVTADNDELNRQFFSLLIARKFQPLKGTITAGGSAAIDLVESQINAALSNLSDNYKLNVDYGEEKTFGEKSFEVGFKKGLLNDRLIISSSIGVESKNVSGESSVSNSSVGSGDGASKSNALIGDVNIEYIINDKGTFRANIFNKSNTNSVNENAGPFTQGAGISYLEEFNNWNDFELIQYGLDVFRKSDKKKYKKKQNKARVPKEMINNSQGSVEQVEKRKNKK